MSKNLFKGVATALYTPFDPQTLKIDYNAMKNLLSRQIKADVDALVLLGTTGESATITDNERTELISFTQSILNGRIPLIVGCGSNCTQRAITYAKEAERQKADAVLVVTPYYNKCNEEGLLAHYERICESTMLPIIVYNVPSRTGVGINLKTYEKLLKLPNVVGIKEADSNVKKYRAVLKEFSRETNIYCGTDGNLFDFLKRGAKGAISVTSNIIPEKIKDICLNFKDYSKTMKTTFTLLEKALRCDVNPIPLKRMVQILYGEGYGLRLPLSPTNDEKTEYITDILNKLKTEI